MAPFRKMQSSLLAAPNLWYTDVFKQEIQIVIKIFQHLCSNTIPSPIPAFVPFFKGRGRRTQASDRLPQTPFSHTLVTTSWLLTISCHANSITLKRAHNCCIRVHLQKQNIVQVCLEAIFIALLGCKVEPLSSSNFLKPFSKP